MSDNPTCPQFPTRPPHGGGEPFIAPPAPCRKPGLSVLSVNGRTPDRNGDLALAYIDGAEYAAGYGDPPRPALLFRQGDEVVAVVDATPLLKDGMVSSVEVSGGKLVVTFNTDAGKEPVEIPLTDIFDPASYYDKAAVDGRFALKGEMSVAAGTGADADKTTITLMPGVLATVLSAHQPLDAYFNAAEYDSAGRKILLKHGSVVKAQIDATAFIKDGMVSSVAISSGKLVITFNTDAGLEPIEIPLTDIFNPANYYDKTATNTLLSGKADKVANATSGNLAALDENGNLVDSGNRVAGAFAADSFIGGGSGMVGFELNSTSEGVELYVYDGVGKILKFPLREGTLAVQDDIAPTFNETGAYDEGALVFHNGLYRCVNANGHTGAWVAADFAESTVDDVLAALRTALSGKADKVANATSGNLAALDENGNLTDSGMALRDFAVAESLAPVFVAGAAYEVGDLCTSFDNDEQHKGAWLYKCILATDGSQPTWPETDPTHWALATVEDLLAALRTALSGKADASSLAPVATSGNYDDLRGKPGNVSAFANDAGYLTSHQQLRYAMPESVALVAENDAATLVCADRAVTNATIVTGFSTLNLSFPAAVSGYVRDFYLRITVAAGESAPAISVPQGITIENAGGAVPEIADGEASAAATTLVWFSETAPGVFTAKSETVKAVA